jgi:hypothetical protein
LGMAFTKGELLSHAIAFALRSVRLSGRRRDLPKMTGCGLPMTPCASCAGSPLGEIQ